MMVLFLLIFSIHYTYYTYYTSGTKVVRFGEDARRHTLRRICIFPLPPSHKTHRGPSNPVHSSAISIS